MSEREPTPPVQHQDDELDVEELEAVAGGGDELEHNTCPITNYQYCNAEVVNP